MFAFETGRIVSRSKIDNVVDDIVKPLEYLKGFPQAHLMTAGSTVAKSSFHSSTPQPEVLSAIAFIVI
jgi:hypothetical protein